MELMGFLDLLAQMVSTVQLVREDL